MGFSRDEEKDLKLNKNKTIVVALAGNPNSGKTSLFNELVGANQKVGNWAGVTIEKYEGIVKYKGYDIKMVDLPGTYSLTAYSPEEVLARHFIIEEKPDVVINVLDGTNIERNLYLTSQLMELKANILIALNMYDEVEKSGNIINIKLLQQLLGSHIIPTSAVKKTGITSLLDHVIRVYTGDIIIAKNKLTYSVRLEEGIERIVEVLNTQEELKARYVLRWLAIKLLEYDQEIYKLVKEYPVWIRVEQIILNIIELLKIDKSEDSETIIAEDRNAFIRGAIKETVIFKEIKRKSVTEWIDTILINRVLGLPIFMLIMWMVFQFTFALGEWPMKWIESIFHYIGNIAIGVIPPGIIRSIIVDAVISGVGGVIVFLPNILLLFIALSFLEGTGYMARAAFVVDKIMHKMGLHGKSFLPMITGFGCSIPAIMATRTLKNRSDRLVTMMIIPFMSCGAKLPVYVLLISAFFKPSVAGNVLFGIYLFGVFVAVVSAKLLKTAMFKCESEPFVMELPPYRLPTMKSILFQARYKAEMYLRKAGTIILGASILIWFASNYPVNSQLNQTYNQEIEKIVQTTTYDKEVKEKMVHKIQLEKESKNLEHSFSGMAGKLVEPIIRPLGFDWRTGVAIIMGLAAKEVVVSTLGTIYSIGEVSGESVDLAKKLQDDPHFTTATALSLMVFVLLYIPCIATMSVFKKESGSWKLIGIYSAYAMSVAWIASFIVYRASIFLGLGS